MSFTSFEFLCFLAITVLLYYLIPKKLQWVLLLVASITFYTFAGGFYLPYILITIVSSYIVSLLIKKNADREKAYIQENKTNLDKEQRKAYKAKEKKKRFSILIVGLIINFGMLAVLKYTGFAISNLNSIIHLFGAENTIGIPDLLLPLGISFYVFQTTGYLIDVYREKTHAETNIFKLGLFVSFFPQLLQGPISRHSDLANQLFEGHKCQWDNISAGLLRIAYGYFKKLIIADTVMIAISKIIGAPDTYTGVYVIFLILAYSVQIYADFTGGIDITIGIAEMLGIKLHENFDHPFASKSTKEYWNRWHITMGSWFTDYVFYPLSICKPMQKLSKWSRSKLGNALGKRIPVYLATIFTWFLTGLWHGASWNFIVWGVLNGVIILISRELEPLYARFRKKFPRLTASAAYGGFMCVRTFFLMGAVRILDCYRDVPVTAKAFASIFYDFSHWGDLVSGSFMEKLGLSLPVWIVMGLSTVLIFFVSRASGAASGTGGKDTPVADRLSTRPVLWTLACLGLAVTVLIFGSYGMGFDAGAFIYGTF